MTDSIFTGADQFTSNQRLPFLNAGVYTLEVLTIQEKVTYEDKVPYLKADVKVLASSGEKANAEGSTATIMIKRRKHNMHLKDIKSLASAITGEPQDKITKAMLAELVSSENPAKGVSFRAEVSLDSKDGKSFPVSRYFATGAVKEPAKGKSKAA